MMIKKLVTFEDLGFVQWGVLDEDETGVYSAIALEEAFFTPFPETLFEFVEQGNEGLLALADSLEQNERTGAVKAKPLGTIHILPPLPELHKNIFVSVKIMPNISKNSTRKKGVLYQNSRNSLRKPRHASSVRKRL